MAHDCRLANCEIDISEDGTGRCTKGMVGLKRPVAQEARRNLTVDPGSLIST